jgi:DNA polymerase-4
MTQRKIIHVDMDAFFASIEQRDEPQYRGEPVVVGGRPDSRGVVAACSYEARRFGIHSAMPCSHAYRLCPETIFVRPRFEVYRQVSKQIHAIFSSFSDQLEPLSLDEAYLDVSDCKQYEGSATRIAQAIKERIHEETGLTASAGVSHNKFLAKTASDMDKPDGLYVILPDQGEAFIAALPIGEFYGVGSVTERKMNALGIYNGGDLRAHSLQSLQAHFGKAAQYYYQIARGIDERPIKTQRERKSIGSETTFAEDLLDVAEMVAQLERLAERVVCHLQSKDLSAKTLTIKVKYGDFKQVTRSYTARNRITDASQIYEWIPLLLAKTQAGEKPVRLLGVSVSSLASKQDTVGIQLSLEL